MFTKKKYTYITTWQSNSQIKRLVKIEKHFERVFFVLFNIQNVYIKYLDLANKVNKKYNEIHTYILGLKKEFHISNKKKNKQFFIFNNKT